ncbi:MAG: error-prone DNA polymerase [Alphaproteobacteria bacterium]|nr:error-prone DNA polymerase [Alphaproteobacteria bacterium]
MTAYAELQLTSNFSFLRGASHPEEMVETAAALGHAAVAITDRNTLAGVVRAHVAAKAAGIRLVVGARLDLVDAPSLLYLPTDRPAYGRLARLLTIGKRRAPKGECHIGLAEALDHGDGQIVIALAPETGAPETGFAAHLARLAARFGDRVFLAAQHLYRGDDRARITALAAAARTAGIALVATNDVHAHAPGRRQLQDVLTAVRLHTTVETAGWALHANAERHLKPADEMARLFRRFPDAVARTAAIAEACRFSLDELRYEYPDDEAPPGIGPQAALERLTRDGARRRYPGGVPDKVRRALDHELGLIGTLGYAPYFLTVHDIVRFARARGILCQGRGSAANSAVCYCLDITAVDPERMDLLFERFISAERNEPPDIDVDFEHERREEVIQYIYAKYGRARAGIAATVIHYRTRSAIRDVGKALGLSADTIDALADTVWGWRSEDLEEKHVREIGLDPTTPRLRLALSLARTLRDFPRHLSQHVGGFVITRGPLAEVVPIANAAMEDRTTIEWDKDDLDALGILKIDVLALGMLSCIRKGLDLLARHHGRRLALAEVPAEDSAVYNMLCKADSIGVFQVESRAQMTMLPRLKPRNFYDLVIEVAIVRPGPIQGDMLHPYLRRRSGKETVSFPSEALAGVLAKTLGVPLFQEQAMRIAIVAAGFTPSEADSLRRAMATFRRAGTIHGFREKLIRGMVANGYDRDFAERCFKQIEGFGEYGFPESHAASFALLVYVSSWLKCHYPAAFACALLNSQPMGFYAPAQIVRDAAEHGVVVRAVDVNHSDWDSTLEPDAEDRPALRLGLRQVSGFAEAAAAAIVARRDRPFASPADLQRRTLIGVPALEALARADAFGSMGLARRRALWAIRALGPEPLPLFAAHGEGRADPPVALPAMAPGEEVAQDYAALRLSLKAHPLALLRTRLAIEGVLPHARLAATANGRRVAVAGLVLIRQRPGTASGVIFMTLEDETGVANVVVWPSVFERFRREVLTARLLRVHGPVQREGNVVHVIAERMTDLTDRLRVLATPPDARDPAAAITPPLARADEVGRTVTDRRLYPSRDFH